MIVDTSRDIATIAGSLPPDQLLNVIGVEDTTPIVDVTRDSREVRPGWAFACVVGEHFDGHDFAAEAVDAGAAALLVERPLPFDVPQVVVRDVRRAMGWFAVGVHGHPATKLRTVGITGTNGKTTTSHLVAAILRSAGIETRVQGTLSGVRTTPEATDLQRLLAEYVADGVEAVVMEVSSHALALHRVAGMQFDVAVFTNLGRDHLDLHESMEAYFRAKASLFARSQSRHGVTNVDDPYGRLLLDAAEIDVTGFSLADASHPESGADRVSFEWRGRRVVVPLGGHFNVMNALAALTAADVFGIDPDVAVAGIAMTPPVPGRFEVVTEPGVHPFSVVVDYAHTPDALAGVLATARSVTPAGDVVVVFGCGGDRDADKRPLMGAAAAANADRVIVTSDNPRHEEPQAIIDAALSGIEPRYGGAVRVEPDRRRAIELAIRDARPGDVIVIAGKGHETTQTIGDIATSFDDRSVAREVLAQLRGSTRIDRRASVIAVMIAGAVATLVSLLGTRFLIVFFGTRGRGQPILGKDDHGPEHHMLKQGTPTMGGLAIVVAAFIGWIVAHIRDIAFSDQAMIVWVGVLAMSLMGFLDDWIKVRKGHNRGIFWKQKNYITMLMSFGFAWWLVATTGISETISFVRAGDLKFEVPTAVWVIWAGLVIWATTNAVNVTDGLDGLAGGSALMGFGAFMIIGYWAFRNPDVYGAVVNPLDMGVLAAGFAGACLGFLWWNAAPARIFMGDVGALGIGSALAFLALTLNTHLLLILICGINVMEAGSVAIQMGVFKATGRKRRLFRMSPIHHHFELAGWPETTVIIRFWLLSAISVASALAIFIGDFTRVTGGIGG